MPVLLQNGITSEESPDHIIMVTDPVSIKNPEQIATLLVNHQLPPSLLHIVEEDLESYFLRLITEKEPSL
jgi:ABC-2 type transport system ATP-binding protein